MCILAGNKRNSLKLLLLCLLFCFSFSAEARFGGGSHGSSSHSSSSHSSYHGSPSRYKSNPQKISAKAAFWSISLGLMVLFFPTCWRVFTGSSKPPRDINKLVFARFLRERFMLLQKLWDNDDWSEIERYVDISMLSTLKQKRAATKSWDASKTIIRNLNTYIKGFKTTKDHCEVNVEFSGLDNDVYFKEEWTFKRSGGAGLPWILTQLVVKK